MGSLVITLCHPDGVPERPMREALDWLVDRLESGWATHAVMAGRLLLGKQPYQACGQQD